MKAIVIFSLFVFAACSLPAGAWDEGHHHELTEQQIGAVRFETSCLNSVAAEFNHAVALLHSFQYEQASAMFTAIGQKDPGCAVAQWGLAMSHYHGLWGNGDMQAGSAALANAQA